MAVTRQRWTSDRGVHDVQLPGSRGRVPWERHVPSDACACDQSAACLYHYGHMTPPDLARTWELVGIQPPIGR